MHTTTCTCGRVVASPDVTTCPFCREDLSDMSEEASSKHIRKCAMKTNPQMCSQGKVGRPSRKCIAKPDYLREDLPRSHRSCENCGRCGCPRKGAVCIDWSMQEPRCCPFCGREAQKVIRNGVLHAITCGYCNTRMDAYDVSRGDEALVDRWNGGLLRE